ncbi:MAG: tetratricopeptide repeat protein [Rectinemataceae bacterium]
MNTSKLVLILALAAVFLPPVSTYAQTPLKMASPSDLAKIANERAEIEKLIAKGNPESLKKAAKAAASASYLSEADRAVLRDVVAGVEAILYAEPTVSGPSSRSSNSEAQRLPAGSMKAVDTACLAALEEARAGKVSPLQSGTEGNPLAELLPVLALFRTENKEATRLALDAADRFRKLGLESAVPGLAKALDAERRGDSAAALSGYRTLLDSYPDLWLAALGEGRVLLALGRPAESLSILETAAPLHKDDIRFRAPYALALYRNGRFADAEPFVAKALAAEPVSVELTAAMAHIFVFRGEYLRAAPLLDTWAKQRPGDRLLQSLRIQSASGLKKPDEALAWARKALKTYPDDPELMTLTAAALFEGPESGHAEAVALAETALVLFDSGGGSESLPDSPLRKITLDLAEGEAGRLLLAEAYRHQDWYRAASLLEQTSGGSVDRNVVATILRKSGRLDDAVKYSRAWFEESAGSEESADAYLRSLAAATGGRLASAAPPGASGLPSPLAGLLATGGIAGNIAGSVAGEAGGNAGTTVPLVDLILRLMSGSYSSRMKSYLLYLQGSLSSTESAAMVSYRAALMENADNIDALIALAELYARRGERDKAGFYLKQAQALGSADTDTEARISALAVKIAP